MNKSYNSFNITLYNFNKTTRTYNNTVIRDWDIWDFSLLGLWIFALLGNTLTILVMRSKKMRKTNTALFLTFLAAADISVLTLKFLIFLQKLYRIPLYNFCVFVNILPDIAAYTSYWLIITTTIERCIAVFNPLKVTQIVTKRRCIVSVILMISFFSLLSFTQFFCLEVRPDKPHYCRVKGPEGKGPYLFYMKTIYPYIKSALMSWIPSILGIVLNMLIIISLMNASKKRDLISNKNKKSQMKRNENEVSRSHLKSILKNQKILSKKKNILFKSQSDIELSVITSNQDFKDQGSDFRLKKVKKTLMPQISQERQITIMLISISLTFLVFTLPFSIHELFRKLYPTDKKFQNRIAQRTVLFFLDCLHATNFILYCLIGKKFRNELINILTCRKETREKISSKASSVCIVQV
jgi:hypothetical protein